MEAEVKKEKKSKGQSPLSRSMGRLRDAGYTVAKTEHFNMWVKRRQDLFGFADCVAVRPDKPGVLAVNTMHLRNRTEHDYSNNTALPVWLAAGNRFVLHQWHCVGERGKRKLWELVIQKITVADLKPKETKDNGETESVARNGEPQVSRPERRSRKVCRVSGRPHGVAAAGD